MLNRLLSAGWSLGLRICQRVDEMASFGRFITRDGNRVPGLAVLAWFCPPDFSQHNKAPGNGAGF